MAEAVLKISSRNYSSWSLRGWLLCRMGGLSLREEIVPPDDAAARAELLLLSPSFLVPCLIHDGVTVWDTLAIGEYVAEVAPKAGILPESRAARAHCRAVSGEMHSGFQNLRSALPMNLKAHYPGFKVWAGALADIARIEAIWAECRSAHGGPWLFGDKPTLADAMFAPVATRFRTYDVQLSAGAAAYRDHVLDWPLLREWTVAAMLEPDEIDELDAEF